MDIQTYMTPAAALPEDRDRAVLVGRIWLPGTIAGPAVVAVRGEEVVDLSPLAPTMSDLVNATDPLAIARDPSAQTVARLDELLANSAWDKVDRRKPSLLAPTDLLAIKAAGVTFVKSMLERVIEEQARGDASKADGIRARIEGLIGGDLRQIEPGSPQAMALKEHLIEAGAWSQYLEVGIGPDAEIFTKAQPMSAVGHGAQCGVHAASAWNNPEPEVVLVVNAHGRIVGATLGNDVNLRDVEGRSALLLGKAKDNNAACAMGPFIRLCDEGFTLDDIRSQVITLVVEGRDGFRLDGSSSMAEISRDIEALVAGMMNDSHQYPDGAVLFCGTMFAPTEDRGAPGQGFTHARGDIVTIASPKLGCLANQVEHCDKVPAWTYGTTALMRNLAARGLLG